MPDEIKKEQPTEIKEKDAEEISDKDLDQASGGGGALTLLWYLKPRGNGPDL